MATAASSLRRNCCSCGLPLCLSGLAGLHFVVWQGQWIVAGVWLGPGEGAGNQRGPWGGAGFWLGPEGAGQQQGPAEEVCCRRRRSERWHRGGFLSPAAWCSPPTPRSIYR